MPILNKRRYFFPAYSFAILIFIFSSLPTEEIEKAQASNKILRLLLSDYFMHFCAFGIFAWLLCHGFRKIKNSRLPFLKIGSLALGYGLFIEIYQLMLPHRSFRLDDLAADAVGIAISLILFKIFMKELQ